MSAIGRVLLAAAALAGAWSGPAALAAGAASQPPIEWRDLAVIAIAALVGLPAVLGFQVLLGNLNALRLGWRIFLGGAFYGAAAGLVAVFIAWRGAALVPHAFVCLVAGLGMLGGLGLVRVALRRQLAPA